MKKFAVSAVVISFIVALTLFISGCTEPPAADFVIDKETVSTGSAVSFDDLSFGEIVSWSWDFGDGTTSDEQNPSHVYSKKGNYTVSLATSNKAGNSIATKVITVLELPVAKMSVKSKTYAVAAEISFADASTGDISSCIWSFGDGTTSQAQHPVHTYSEKGTYIVSLAVSNQLESDTQTLDLQILEPPAADFIVDESVVAAGSEIIFADSSTGDITSYLWDFGDGETSTDKNPAHAYKRGGKIYTVSLNVSNEVGTDTVNKSIEVLEPVSADFSTLLNIVKTKVGTPLKFNDNSRGDVESWWWDFGDGTTSNERNPSHTYETGGLYTIKLTVGNKISSDTMVKDSHITITTIDIIRIDWCSNIDANGQRTVKMMGNFYVGDDIWLTFKVDGFEQVATKDGYEVWVSLTRLKVTNPDGERVIDQADVSEARGVILEADPSAYAWFQVPIGSAEPSDPFGEYSVVIEIKDMLSGDEYFAHSFFTIEKEYVAK